MNVFGKGAGYRSMDAYLLAWVIELATDTFCTTFLSYKNDPQGKTSAQMNHAARSGCRNFAEGCERLMTSTASGIDLLNVAKGSLSELRDDYLKWILRARRLPWDDADPQAQAVRALNLDPSPGAGSPYSNRHFCEHLLAQYTKFAQWLECADSFVRADALVILCIRAVKMQNAYILHLGEEFKASGGFKERLGEARREQRALQEGGVSAADAPHCPECGTAMRLQHRRRDNSPFWGCGGYPGCRGTLPVAQVAAATGATVAAGA